MTAVTHAERLAPISEQDLAELLVVRSSGAISAEAPTPLYFQLYSLLKSMILDGTLAHGQKIPAEEQLAGAFNVSRITAKRAMDELAQDGLVERRRGRGSHVTFRYQPRPVQAPMVGLLEEIEQVARVSEAITLECHFGRPPFQIRTEFGFEGDEEALHLARVRESDGLKFGYYSSWTRWSDEITDPGVFKEIPRLHYFKERGLRVNYATQTLSATPANALISAALDVAEGAALLRLVRRSFYKEGERLVLKDHLNVYYNPEFFQYQMSMTLED